MKTLALLSIASVTLLSAAIASAQFPQNAAMTILPAGSSTVVTVDDPGDRVWILQTSPDFNTWTDAGAWKVHNGTFHRTLTRGDAKLFYRALFDPNRQDISSTVATALRLPPTLFNYSPPLPPYYVAPPVSGQDNTP